MIIKVDKCPRFCIKKQFTKSAQYLRKRLYSRYALSKISWHFAVSDMSKTGVNEKLDNMVSTNIRKWLHFPISATLGIVMLPPNKFEQNIVLPSTKFLQCQTVCR